MEKRIIGLPAVLCILALAGCRAEAPPRTTTTTMLAVADTTATHPATAVDPRSGAVYVAYTARAGGETNVYLARLDAGAETLGGPARVNDVPGDAATHPQAPAQVRVGPEGRVYVAWITQRPVEGRRFPASDIRLARSEDGGRTFAPAVTVNPDAGFPTGHHFHNLAVGPEGTVYVSWLDGSARDRAQQARAAPAEGHGHETAGADGLPGTQLYVARSADGGRTFMPVVVAEGTCQCCRTALAVSAGGTVYVVWRQIFGDQIRDMALARSEDGGRTFSAPVRVHADDWQINGCPHAGPAVAVDAHDRVHVAWYTGRSGRAGVYYAASRDGGRTFGPAVVLAGDVPVAQASMTAAGDGIRVAWEDPRQDRVYVQHAGDAAPDLVSVAAFPGAGPALAAHDATDVLAWRDAGRVRLRVVRP